MTIGKPIQNGFSSSSQEQIEASFALFTFLDYAYAFGTFMGMRKIASFLLILCALPAMAVEINSSGGYQNTTPSTVGDYYVGQINGGASGVYLGDGFVLTAGHVGAGTFALGGVFYSEVAGSAQNIGTADLTLFQIADAPSLPALTLALDAPVPFSNSSTGSSVVMIGFGGSHGETYGEDNVTEINETVTLSGTSFSSTDFYTIDGTYTNYHHESITNNAQLISGDSGGGDFIENPSTGVWELAGINEAQLINSETGAVVGSAMVQLSSYDATIEALMATDLEADAVPEPSTWAMVLGGLTLLGFCVHRRLAPVRV
jgi:hypothetical protein